MSNENDATRIESDDEEEGFGDKDPLDSVDDEDEGSPSHEDLVG